MLPGKMNPVRIFVLPAIIAAMIAVLWFVGLKDYLSLDNIQSSGAYFKSMIDDHFVLGMMIYAVLYIVVVVSCLPVVALVSLMAGFLFGMVWGVILVLLSATIGAAILFLIARSSFGVILRERAGLFYARVEKQMNQGAISYMLFMRLVPVMPFSIANIVPALLNVSFRPFIVTTVIGIAPSAIILVNTGRAMGQISGMSDLFSPQTLVALGLLALCALLPALVRLMRKNSSTSP